MIFFNHAHSSVQQVAQVVCQIGVNTVDKRITGEVAVAAQIDFTQQEIADSVSTKFVNQAQRVNNIAFRLGHLVAFYNQPAMSVYFFRQRLTHSHQHNRPNDSMETHDFLTYQMQACRPVFLEFFRIAAVADTGEIVQQRIEPYIYNMFFIERYRNAPVESCSGNAQVFQTLFDEVNHLIAAADRLDKIRMSFNILQQSVLIF